MDAKHTPGPWTYRHFALADIYSDDQRAEMRALHPEYFEVGSAYDESYNRLSLSAHMGEANARLIAAAPMLLEALQNIVASLSEHDDEGMIEHAEQMIAARAAIATATGAA